MSAATHGLAPLDDPQTDRQGVADLLSLALIDSRNHLLQRLAGDESEPALAIAAEAGHRAEHWIARHVQRGRGEAAVADAPRLGGVEPRSADWAAGRNLPPPDELRAYLQQTLETTLDLLAASADSDAALHFYRLALRFEDRCGERLAALALQRPGAGAPPSRAEREPLWLPAQRWQLGSAPGGTVPENERWAHEALLPEFEIDAQAVNWSRYAEFALDGGYDRAEFWTPAGWSWLQAEGRRAPLGVAQFAGGVLLERGAGLQRAPAQQPAVGVTRFEAEAWCRWAGRRLPTEPEWEAAACTAVTRGFVWGDVLEWVAGSARAWPGHAPVAGDVDPVPAAGTSPMPGVLRGACWLTRQRARHPKARRFALPGQATMLGGFRRCTF
jgi:iron(II)-dependent oxidoreductase